MANQSWFESNGYEAPNGNTGFTGLAPGGLTPAGGFGVDESQLGYNTQGGLTPSGPIGSQLPQPPGHYEGVDLDRHFVPDDPNWSKQGAFNEVQGGGNPTDRNYVKQQLTNLMQQHGITPGGRGSGPADIEYYTDEAMQTGGWTPDNAGYWQDRWQSDAKGGGSAGSGGGVGGFSGGQYTGALLSPYGGQAPSFNAPTGLNFQNDPGYQERLKMGTDAVQSSAAAKGTLLTGGTLKDLAKFGQDYASNEFGNVFNRALQGHQADMGTFGANYDIFRNNQTDPFNKLYSLTGLGLNAAGGANSAGSLYGNQVGNNASNYGNLATGYANNAGNAIENMGNVNAAGIAGQYNAYGPALGSIFDWYQGRQNKPPQSQWSA